MPTDDELNQAAQTLGSTLNRMLEAAPFDDPAHMEITELDRIRRWYAEQRGSARLGSNRKEDKS